MATISDTIICNYALTILGAKRINSLTEDVKNARECNAIYELVRNSVFTDHPSWKGGRIKDGSGYILIKEFNHPFRNKRNYVFEHRLIIEKEINRYLLSKEQCHHINEIKNDNKLKNLIAFINQSAHQRFHRNPQNVKPSEIIFDGRQV